MHLPNRLVYRVRPENPEAHLFIVELEISSPPHPEIALSIPAWIPGSYMIRDFARNVVSIGAADCAGPIPVEKRDKQTWRLSATGNAVTLSYRVYALELGVRAAHLDNTHAYFNGPSLFLRVRGLDDVPCRVELAPPPGEGYAHWRVATSLAPVDTGTRGFGTYRADDYQDLIDHPVEMGTFCVIPFSVRGVPHRMAITGRHRADEARLKRDLARICETHAALFGELPIDRYLFLTTAVGDGYGGLEHRFSTSLLCSRDELPRPGDSNVAPGYRRFLGLCSHEYFHLWNVKRIRPRVFMDEGLDREVHTRLLWVFEGITSYYDKLTLVRSGCIDEKGYLELLAETVTRVTRNPGRLVQTVAESSFDAWTKFYQQDENAPNAIVSYYGKGALIALALDLTIRSETGDAKSLDDLMRALWERHGKPGIGVPERGVEDLANDVTGLDLDGFFEQALDSTEDLDLVGLLETMGVGLRLRPSRDPKDLGGVAGEVKDEPTRSDLGIRLKPGVGESVIGVVLAGSPAQEAGLAPGDTLVALDGIRIQPEKLDGMLAELPQGAEAVIHAFRRDELMRLRVRPRPALADTCELRILTDLPDEFADRRAGWLGLKETNQSRQWKLT
jgi:predicted metalloprotease with PDZ domain